MKPLQFERRSLGSLKPDPANPRSMPEEQMKALETSIDRWGLVDPIVINKDGTIIGGHQRYEALKRKGIAEADVVVLDLPENEARALNIALNRIHGDWDVGKLESLLQDLEASGIDLQLTGFSQDEIDKLLNAGEFSPIPEDAVPRLDERKKVKCPECGHEFAP